MPAAPPTAPPPAGPRLVERPERAPRLVRAALPVYPPEARRGRVRARARVRVLVGEGGDVLDAEVVERAVLDGGAETAVAALPFGLEAAALVAARRHRFPGRPRRRRARPVVGSPLAHVRPAALGQRLAEAAGDPAGGRSGRRPASLRTSLWTVPSLALFWTAATSRQRSWPVAPSTTTSSTATPDTS